MRHSCCSIRNDYVDSSDRIIKKTIKQYIKFVADRQRTVDTERWVRLKIDRGLRLYQERRESTTSSMRDTSFTASSIDSITDNQYEDERQSTYSIQTDCNTPICFQSGSHVYDTKLVSAFGGGQLQGNLQAVMEGLYVDTTAQMKTQCQIQYPGFLDCCVLDTMEQHDPVQAPYRFYGVKWLQKSSNVSGVIDEICYIERMGVMLDLSGRPFGYQLVKSVDMDAPQRTRVDMASYRINLSICYIYNQISDDRTEVYIRGIVEVPMDPDKSNLAINAAAEYILAPVKAKACAQMKKISDLILQSKTERADRLVCHCSKMIRGLPKMDLCSSCKETMKSAKLVPIRDLQRGLLQDDLTASLGHSLSSSMLESRRGYLRHDGQVPDETKSYNEASSLRMFMPIRDPRPDTTYRTERKENVLTRMLRHHEQKQRYQASNQSSC